MANVWAFRNIAREPHPELLPGAHQLDEQRDETMTRLDAVLATMQEELDQ